MKVLHPRRALKPLVVVFALLATSALVYAAVTGKIDAERYSSTPGSSFAVTDAGGGGCKKVTNNSSNSYFIPTKTAAEWNAFKSAASRLSVSLSEAVDTYTSTFKEVYPGTTNSDLYTKQTDTCDGDKWNMYTCPSNVTATCTDVYVGLQSKWWDCWIGGPVPLARVDSVHCEIKCELSPETSRAVTWDTTTDLAHWPGYPIGDTFMSQSEYDHWYDGC